MILVGLQGAASIVAAQILKGQGESVRAVHFTARSALGAIDESDRLAAWCVREGIELAVVDVSDEFEHHIVDGFVHSVLKGHTFEPRLRWMQAIVLPKLADLAAQADARWATGHFALSVRKLEKMDCVISQPHEAASDQSIDFYPMSAADLVRLELPLGSLARVMVHKLAQDAGWDAAQDRPSVVVVRAGEPLPGADIEWLEQRIPADLRPRGIIKNASGQVHDEHTGIHRHRLGSVHGRVSVQGETMHQERVIELDPRNAVVVVGDTSELASRQYVLGHMKWLFVGSEEGARGTGHLPITGLRVTVSGEGWPAQVPATILPYAGDRLSLVLDAPCAALPGAAIAFYEGRDLLGGALIERRLSG